VQPFRVVQRLQPGSLIDGGLAADGAKFVKACPNFVNVRQAHEQDLRRGVVLRILDAAAASPISDADDVGSSVDDQYFLQLAVGSASRRSNFCRQIFERRNAVDAGSRVVRAVVRVEVRSVNVVAGEDTCVGRQVPGPGVEGAGLGDGVDQLLILGRSPAEPTDCRLRTPEAEKRNKNVTNFSLLISFVILTTQTATSFERIISKNGVVNKG